MKISSSVLKRVLISIISLIIGIVLYWLFNINLISKNNLICTIIRNYLLDGIWVISFFFMAVNFSKNITRKYLLLNSIFIFITGFIFEIMQLTNIAKGTFDIIDIFVYLITIIIACLIEKELMEVEK